MVAGSRFNNDFWTINPRNAIFVWTTKWFKKPGRPSCQPGSLHVRRSSPNDAAFCLFIFGRGFVAVDASRVVPYLTEKSHGNFTGQRQMFEAYGILERHYLVIHKRRGHTYIFDE